MYRICLLYILLFSISLGKLNIDSAYTEIQKIANDSLRSLKLSRLANKLYSIDNEKGKKIANEALGLSKAIENEELIAESYIILSVNSWASSDFLKSLIYLDSAEEISKQTDDKKVLSNIQINKGLNYVYLKDFDKAEKSYKLGMKYILESGDTLEYYQTFLNYGQMLQNSGKFEKAEKHYLEALEFFENQPSSRTKLKLLTNIAVLYVDTDNYIAALDYFSEAIKMADEMGNKRTLSINLINKGSLYFILSNDKELLDSINKYSKYNFESGNLLKESIYLVRKAKQNFLELNSKNELYATYYQLAEIYIESQEPDSAFHYLKKSLDLKEEMLNDDTRKKLDNLEAIKDNQLQLKEIELLKQQNKNDRYLLLLIAILLVFAITIVILIYRQRKKRDDLIRQILPESAVEELLHSHKKISHSVDSATVCFVDIVDFSSITKSKTSSIVVEILNSLFSSFDNIAKEKNLEKIKTIGDSYMIAGGIPKALIDHADQTVKFAQECFKILEDINKKHDENINFRVGIHSGEVTGGIIGENKLFYDLWGDTVNIAARLEDSGIPGEILITDQTKDLLRDSFVLVDNGEMDLKGIGIVHTWKVK